MSLDYFGLIKKAAQITWKYRYLWFFGMFLGAVGGGGGANWNLGSGDFDSLSDKGAQDFAGVVLVVVLVIAALMLLVALAFWIMAILSEGALIGSVAELDEGKPGNIRSGLRIGAKYFWKIFGASFFVGIVSAVIAMIIVVPMVFLFMWELWVHAIVLIVFALMLMIPAIIFVSLLLEYTYRAIVLEGKGVFAAFGRAFAVLRFAAGPTALVFLLNFFIRAFVGGITMLVTFFIGVPVGIFAFMSMLTLGPAGLLFLIPVGLAFLCVSLFVAAVANTFTSALWTLAYRDMAKHSGT